MAQIQFWSIEMRTGAYEDKRDLPIEHWADEKMAKQRFEELKAELVAGGFDKGLVFDYNKDADENEETDPMDRRFHGLLVDYNGARLYLVGPSVLNVPDKEPA